MDGAPKVSEMVVSCSATGCTNRQGDKPNLAFHRFPGTNDLERRHRWTTAIRKKYWEPGPYARVCGEHFIQGKKSDNPHHPDYVPSIFSYSSPLSRARGLKKLERFLRHAEINRKKSDNLNTQNVATAHPDQHHSSESKGDVTEPMDQNPPCTLYITKLVHQNPPSNNPGNTVLLDQDHSSKSTADVKEPVPQNPPFTLYIRKVVHQTPPGTTAPPGSPNSSESKADVTKLMHLNLPSNVPVTTASLSHHQSSESKADVKRPVHQNPLVIAAELGHQNQPSGSTALQDQQHGSEYQTNFKPEGQNRPFLLYFKNLLNQNPFSNVPSTTTTPDHNYSSDSKADLTELMDEKPPLALSDAESAHQIPLSNVRGVAISDRNHDAEVEAKVTELYQNSPSNAPVTIFLQKWHDSPESEICIKGSAHRSPPFINIVKSEHQNPPSKAHVSTALQDVTKPVDQHPPFVLYVTKPLNQNPSSDAPVTLALLDQHHHSESKVDVSELTHPIKVEATRPIKVEATRPIKVEASESECQISNPLVHSTEVQTDETHGNIAELHKQIKSLNTECQSLKDKVNELEMRLKNQSFKISVFNDAKVEYFTGLPNMQTYMLLLTYVSSVVPLCGSLELSQELLLTLMKLRLNLTDEFLGYLFGIQQSIVSAIFQQWTKVMAGRLQSLILWPDREELRRSLPTCYQTEFQNCVSIVDCFEVLIKHPPRAKTWTSYKEHNTMKFLISFTPEGTISFVSKAWLGGVTTNRHIIENSGFLEKLQPGDLVLSEWGLEANDHDGLYCAEVVSSPTKGCEKRLSRKEIALSQNNLQVRIHVKRLIGMLRQRFALLGSTLPLSFTNVGRKGTEDDSMAEQIVVICSALCNLCESVVPSEVSE